jgi:hypothetical protein
VLGMRNMRDSVKRMVGDAFLLVLCLRDALEEGVLGGNDAFGVSISYSHK